VLGSEVEDPPGTATMTATTSATGRNPANERMTNGATVRMTAIAVAPAPEKAVTKLSRGDKKKNFDFVRFSTEALQNLRFVYKFFEFTTVKGKLGGLQLDVKPQQSLVVFNMIKCHVIHLRQHIRTLDKLVDGLLDVSPFLGPFSKRAAHRTSS